jgi:hypothetical protein
MAFPRQSVATYGNGSGLFEPLSRPSGLQPVCHRSRPLCSINAPWPRWGTELDNASQRGCAEVRSRVPSTLRICSSYVRGPSAARRRACRSRAACAAAPRSGTSRPELCVGADGDRDLRSPSGTATCRRRRRASLRRAAASPLPVTPRSESQDNCSTPRPNRRRVVFGRTSAAFLERRSRAEASIAPPARRGGRRRRSGSDASAEDAKQLHAKSGRDTASRLE